MNKSCHTQVLLPDGTHVNAGGWPHGHHQLSDRRELAALLRQVYPLMNRDVERERARKREREIQKGVGLTTGWRRVLRCLVFIDIFRKRALSSVALLRKMTCNLRHLMDLRHPVAVRSPRIGGLAETGICSHMEKEVEKKRARKREREVERDVFCETEVERLLF